MPKFETLIVVRGTRVLGDGSLVVESLSFGPVWMALAVSVLSGCEFFGEVRVGMV